uniref:G-protein coupled receptors family 1 profile domain-containing protein n=1 Tax=Biomphalaria glabrata TaxID=6526 RepID=A0A2C9L452_BIOGL
MELVSASQNRSIRAVNLTLSQSDILSAVTQDSSFTSTANSVRGAINLVLIPILCFFGFVGNLVNMIVLRRYGFKETNILFLTSLSVADFLLTVFHALIRVRHIIEQFDIAAAFLIGSLTSIYLYTPYQMMVSINVCHITTIAVERAIAVCMPFRASNLFSRSRTKACIFFIYIFPVVMLSPALFLYQHQWVYSPVLNLTIAVGVETEFFQVNREPVMIYLSMVVGNLFSSVVPFVIIACCLIVSLKLLKRQLNFLSKVTRKETKGLKGMKMLFSVCLVAILIAVPGIVLVNYCTFSHMAPGVMYDLLIDISNLLCQLHSSTNFIIYVTMSNKFLKAYKKLFCRF